MFLSTTLSALLALAAFAGTAHAHGVLTAVAGANGVSGQGFGVIASTPRTGSTRNPFQQDTSIIRDQEVRNGKAGVCGRTLAGGNNDVATQLNAAVTAGLPAAAADGTVSMTLHQVNGDGAGPYTCEVSTDATGASFAAMTVTTNVPGLNSLSNAKATNFALVAQMPAGTTCTGGAAGDACLVRCRNAAIAGPFGGCVAVSAGNATAAAAAGVSTAVAGTTAAAGTDVSTAAAATGTAVADSATGTAAAVGAAATGAPAGTTAATGTTGASNAIDTTGATGTKGAKTGALAKLGLTRRRADSSSDAAAIREAELALAADVERRVRRSRIVGRRGGEGVF